LKRKIIPTKRREIKRIRTKLKIITHYRLGLNGEIEN
jgi:hypothetical protein